MNETRMSPAAANSYGCTGENDTPVTGPGSCSFASVLKAPHRFSSGVERTGASKDCLRTTTGAKESIAGSAGEAADGDGLTDQMRRRWKVIIS